MEYLLHVAVVVGIYMILAVSLDLLAGHGGLLSISHGAFFGIGAYSSALMTVYAGAPFLSGMATGMAVGAILSVVVSLPSLRLHEDYFVLATLAFQIVITGVFNNWHGLTGGPLGIPGIPHPEFFGWTIRSRLGYLILVAVLATAAYGIVARIVTSPFGRVLRAIREDEVLARSLGKDTVRFKVVAFAVSACLAAMAGALFAHYVTYIDPANFTITESILVIAMVIIGGAGSLGGPLVGAAILIVLPEALRFIGLPSAIAGNLRQIFYGILLIVMMLWRPRGILGRYDFER